MIRCEDRVSLVLKLDALVFCLLARVLIPFDLFCGELLYFSPAFGKMLLYAQYICVYDVEIRPFLRTEISSKRFTHQKIAEKM